MGTFILIAIPLTVLLIIYYAVTIWLDLGKMKNSNNGSDEETVLVPPVSDDHHNDEPEDDDCSSDEPMADEPSETENDKSKASQDSAPKFDDDIKPVNVTENDDGFTVGDTSYMPLLPTEPLIKPKPKSIMQRIKEVESSCLDARANLLDGMSESELSDNLLKANLTKVKKEIVIRTAPAHDRL